MNAMQTGLLHRLRRAGRHMKDQHRHLGAIRKELARSLEPGDGPPALETWQGYREALEAHFTLENESFFPALHGLRPEFARDLESLDREHHTLLLALGPIEEALARDALATGADRIQSFHADLADHERREEALMDRVMGELPSANEIDANAT